MNMYYFLTLLILVLKLLFILFAFIDRYGSMGNSERERERMEDELTLYRHCRIFQFRWWWVHSIVVAPLHRPYSNRVQIVLVSLEPVGFEIIAAYRQNDEQKEEEEEEQSIWAFVYRWRKRNERERECQCAAVQVGGQANAHTSEA